MPKLKKGSPEAKAFMAKLRRMKKKSAPAKKKAAPAKKKVVNTKRKPSRVDDLLLLDEIKGRLSKKKAAPRKVATKKRTATVVSGIGSIQSDLNRKLAAAKNYLAILQGKLAYTTELYKQTRGATHKAQLPTIRKKIKEARKVVAQLKKVAK